MPRFWLEAQEDTPCSLADLIVNIDQEIISTSDISSISDKWFNVDSATPETTYFSTTYGTSCIYSAPKTDGFYYDKEGNLVSERGYNMLLRIPASAFPIPSKHVRQEVTLTPTTGDSFVIAYDYTVRRLYGS